jgi:predicted dehydrogenase
MSNKIRVGVIGANPNGSWGTYAHLPALAALDNFETTAVATSHQQTADETAAKFSVANAFGDPQALVEHPDVDVVSICVRVPAHFELVEMALKAGKHVYCEWPLARNSEEAKKLQAMAAETQQVTMIGLQSRHSPVLNYVKDLLASDSASGGIGKVYACQLNHSVDWMPALPASLTYLQDFSSGAHMLSIPGGHSLDAVRWLFGEFKEMSAFLATQITEIDVVDTGEKFSRTSPDQILVSGITTKEVMASVRIQGSSPLGTGVALEINGAKGDLVVKVAAKGRGIQMTDASLYRTTESGDLELMSVPEHYYGIPESIRYNPAMNVARSYQSMAKAIAGKQPVPNFETAVSLHETLDAITQCAKQRKYNIA